MDEGKNNKSGSKQHLSEKHVPEIEIHKRVIKECTIATRSTLPSTERPIRNIFELIKQIVVWINAL